jgi:hypothetical protein
MKQLKPNVWVDMSVLGLLHSADEVARIGLGLALIEQVIDCRIRVVRAVAAAGCEIRGGEVGRGVHIPWYAAGWN